LFPDLRERFSVCPDRAIVIGLVNATVGFVLKILTFPITILTSIVSAGDQRTHAGVGIGAEAGFEVRGSSRLRGRADPGGWEHVDTLIPESKRGPWLGRWRHEAQSARAFSEQERQHIKKEFIDLRVEQPPARFACLSVAEAGSAAIHSLLQPP